MPTITTTLITLSSPSREATPRGQGRFVATFWIVSVGQALQDTHGNAFVAGTRDGRRWLALIHAMYMAGCLFGPFIATAVASAGAVSRW